MRELFGCEVGLSDHTLGIGAAVAAVAMGATVIEKHFTLSRAEGGVDAAFSLEPAELAALVTETERAWQALGEVRYGPTEAEEKARLRRRSLYIAEDLQPGDVLTPQNLRRIRPGHGLPPRYYDVLLGKRVSKAVKAGTPMAWELVLQGCACFAEAMTLQTYTADTMTIDCDNEGFMIRGGLWDGYKLYDLYKWAETPYEWHQPLFDHARRLGITVCSMPFDETALEPLGESLNTPA